MSPYDFPGHELRAQREALGLTLLDAHHETHVPRDYLASLEDGRLDDLPATTYTAGFLNTYCQVLGLQSEPYVTALRACRATAAPERGFLTRTANNPDAHPAWLSDAITWGAVCGVLLLAWIAYSVVVSPFAETTRERVDAGTIEIAPPARFEVE